MKTRKVLGVTLAVIGLLLTHCNSVQAATVSIDNDGNAKDVPYGDSGLANSYSGLDYYDCYVPYNLTIGEIGGYADGVTAYAKSAYNFSMTSAHSERINRTFTTTCMREFDKSGDTFHGCSISTEPETGMNILKDTNGNEYYATAIQNFYYNFGGLAMAEGKNFPEFSACTGQMVDVILTDGTCIHFLVGDANSIGHTNGGPATSQDVTYTFSPVKLPQYKNIYQAANGNSLELWGNKDCTSGFRKKYNLSEDGVRIAYYRMYNATTDTAPTRNSGVGTEVSYSMGSATVTQGSSSLSSTSSLVGEWELEGMPTKSALLEKQRMIYLPTRNDLTVNEANSVALLGDNISISNSASVFDNARICLSFIGLCLVMYSVLMLVAMIFDNVNVFIEMSLVSILTFGKLTYAPDENDLGEKKGLTNTKKLAMSIVLLLIVGMILISGSVLPIMSKIVFSFSQKFL